MPSRRTDLSETVRTGDDARPVIVVSSHLDDGVLSCGRLLATHPGSVQVTVFAGRPRAGTPLTAWDRDGGFRPGDDVVGLRREEDRAALGILGATPAWLEFLDSQYGPSPSVERLADALDTAIGRLGLSAVYTPLGLFHPDHQLTADACLSVMRRRPSRRWFAYEDALYRRLDGLLLPRLTRLRNAGLLGERVAGPSGAADLKHRAILCYTSQLRALTTPGCPGYADAFRPEAYWRLLPNGGSGE